MLITYFRNIWHNEYLLFWSLSEVVKLIRSSDNLLRLKIRRPDESISAVTVYPLELTRIVYNKDTYARVANVDAGKTEAAFHDDDSGDESGSAACLASDISQRPSRQDAQTFRKHLQSLIDEGSL